MNVLAIDAGNTRIKWGWFDGGRWVKKSWIATAEVSKLGAAWAESGPFDAAIVSNVAGETVRGEIARAVKHLGVEPHWIRSAARQCGVTSSYSDPAQLGSDRWAALIGAWYLFRGPCVVASAGTTVTVDALSDEGVFLGGIIIPGVELMQRALAQDTAQLRRQEGQFTYFPDCTADAIMSGAVNALAGAIERMVQFLEQTGQVAPLVVVSGGAASVLLPYLRPRVEVVDNLVLEGLVRIALEQPV